MYGGEVDVCRQNGDSRDEQLLKKGLMMAEDKPVVESFQLDHTKVKAPYVRYIDTQTGPNGDVISNYDLRLVQPNENAIPTGGLHTIEHTIAVLLRERIDGYIDCSPFGCRTGFHLLTWGEHSTRGIAIGGHQLAGMLINLQHGRQIGHSGTTEPPFRGNDALLTHLVHLCITLSSSERQKYHAHGTVFAICSKTDVQSHANQTRRRSNASELMPLARISLHHSFAVNKLWSR